MQIVGMSKMAESLKHSNSNHFRYSINSENVSTQARGQANEGTRKPKIQRAFYLQLLFIDHAIVSLAISCS